jgi:lipooligosaccharide transport system permease protein
MMRVVEREVQVFRRLWRGFVFSTFLSPLMFLAAMGVGLGGLVDENAGLVDGLDYLEFVAPGLLVASAVHVAAGESLWPVLGGAKWMRFFHGMVATPINATEVYGGFVLWGAVRTFFSASVFFAVSALLGAIPSWWGVLAVPAAVLCAAAFGAVLAAFAATQETDLAFPVVMRIAILPLFLFSGTFFPVEQLPAWLEHLAVLSPLYHGVELARAATTGRGDLSLIGHVAVLVAVTAVGAAWGRRSFTQRLAA